MGFISSKTLTGLPRMLNSLPLETHVSLEWVFTSKTPGKVSNVSYHTTLQNTRFFTLKLPSKLLVLSDNTNTVDIFQSLRCKPPYNDLVKFTVSLLLKHHISLRVVHVPGIDNIVADALSCFQNERALAACPGLKISTFQPPQLTMGQEEI